MDYKVVVQYWEKLAKKDAKTMSVLFESKRYPESLFFGHIVLEKVLKALVVLHTKKHAPYTHDLSTLRKTAKLELEEEEVNLLREINDFNINARYPDYKLEFHKKCTAKYTRSYFEKISSLYKKLCQKLRQKKS